LTEVFSPGENEELYKPNHNKQKNKSDVSHIAEFIVSILIIDYVNQLHKRFEFRDNSMIYFCAVSSKGIDKTGGG
jgi:hypothetical protein